MLVTHLGIIAEIEDEKVRELVLKIFKEKEENKGSGDGYTTTVNDVIAVVNIIIDSEIAKGEAKVITEEIGKIIDVIRQKSKDEQSKKRAAKKEQQGKISWERADGKEQLGKSSWKNAAGKEQQGKSS